MKKTGFMFIETIITLTVLLTALLYLYTTFSNLMIKEQSLANYDNVIYQYRLDYIKKNITNLDANLPGTDNYISITVDDNIKAAYELQNLIIVKKVLNNTNLKGMTIPNNNDFTNYLHSSFTEPDYTYTYMIIGEFYDTTLGQYQYAWIGYPIS